MVAWQVGMATMMFMGLVKLALSFAGGWVQRVVPQAGLLGPSLAIGIALLGFLPLTHIFALPVVGMVAFGLVLYTLVARLRLPGNLPGAAVAVLGGTLLYYALGQAGALGAAYDCRPRRLGASRRHCRLWASLQGWRRAVDFLPIAIPFGLLTIVGGINNSESARVAGDEYKTRDILLTEAVATLAGRPHRRCLTVHAVHRPSGLQAHGRPRRVHTRLRSVHRPGRNVRADLVHRGRVAQRRGGADSGVRGSGDRDPGFRCLPSSALSGGRFVVSAQHGLPGADPVEHRHRRAATRGQRSAGGLGPRLLDHASCWETASFSPPCCGAPSAPS